MRIALIRKFVRAIGGPLFVSAIAVASALLPADYTLPICAFMGLGFVLLAAFVGQRAAVAGVIVGTLELAILLPGAGLAVSNAQDALGLVAALTTGLVAAWFAHRESKRSAALAWDLHAARDALDQNQALLGEISHRLANDFAMLVATSSVMARSAASEETKVALADLGGRIAILGRLYSRFRMSDGEERVVTLPDYLRELCEDLRLARFGNRPIALHVDIANVGLPLRRAVILGIITNELLTNVYKHAFPGGRAGTATVTLAHHKFDENTMCLRVADDGIGFILPANRGHSIGHRLLAGLAAQLGGAISFARSDDETIAVVCFPIDTEGLTVTASAGPLGRTTGFDERTAD